MRKFSAHAHDTDRTIHFIAYNEILHSQAIFVYICICYNVVYLVSPAQRAQ